MFKLMLGSSVTIEKSKLTCYWLAKLLWLLCFLDCAKTYVLKTPEDRNVHLGQTSIRERPLEFFPDL